MRMMIALWLPRTLESVAVARQTLDRLLSVFGVRSDCRDEIALAVTEACSNAVRHAAGEAMYELAAESEDSECVITINDGGPGLASAQPDTMPHMDMPAMDMPAVDMPAADAPSGRGMTLMRLMTDRLELHRREGGGLSVRLFKRLRWADGAVGSLPP
jgi:serine/threonine-protein kinase RsbW